MRAPLAYRVRNSEARSVAESIELSRRGHGDYARERRFFGRLADSGSIPDASTNQECPPRWASCFCGSSVIRPSLRLRLSCGLNSRRLHKCCPNSQVLAPQPIQKSSATGRTGQRAWLNRRSLTRTEELLWRELSARKLGVQFRRQVPIAGRFIADFVAPAVKRIVEVDGGYHRTRECADARGMRCWRGWGIARCGFRRRRGV